LRFDLAGRRSGRMGSPVGATGGESSRRCPPCGQSHAQSLDLWRLVVRVGPPRRFANLCSWRWRRPLSLATRRPMRRNLFIIARRVPLMYETLKQSFAGHADIDVILDRRRRERRWQTIPIEVNRRARERRTADIHALLRQLGWVVVEQKID